jgi:hypothetical protein
MTRPTFPWTCALFLLGLLLGSEALVPSPVCAQQGPGTKLWFGFRAGGGFFANTDPDQLEGLSTALSAPIPGQQVEFDPKSWEVPFGVRLGLEFNEFVRVYGMFERIPYLLERDPSDTGALQPPTESIRLEASANVFGGGLDVVLADAAYGQSLIFGIAGGYLEMEGRDQDVLFARNFIMEGTGSYFELWLGAEYEFNDEVTFLPYISVRVAKATDTSYRLSRLLDGQTVPEPFEVDYTGITIGLEGRFQLWPWGEDDEGDRDLPAGGRWEN